MHRIRAADQNLTALIHVVDDLLDELAPRFADREAFIGSFLQKMAETEFAILHDHFKLDIRKFHHPISAVRKYREVMGRAGTYEAIGSAKPSATGPDALEIRFWHCPYAEMCATHEQPICFRGYSMIFAIDFLSESRAKKLERLDFDPEGNCTAQFSVDTKDDLRSISEEERIVEDAFEHQLLRAERVALATRIWIAGLERAIHHLDTVPTQPTLRRLVELLAKRSVTAKCGGLLGQAIEAWSRGVFLVVVPRPAPRAPTA